MAVPLLQYLSTILITMTVSPPGDPNPPHLVLTYEFKQLMRRLLKLMPDPQTNNRCLYGLNAGNIMVDQLGRPSLYAVSWTNYHTDLARMNYARVEEIFRVTIFDRKLASLPPDFQGLLHLMRTEGDVLSYTIQHHCSLVWDDDKNRLFMKRSTDAGMQVLRFMRNIYSHPLEHAWNSATNQQEYCEAQLGEMLETVFPLVLHSFQVELDIQGVLRNISLWNLFH